MLALLAQLFAFQAGWGPPPQAYRPPPPPVLSPRRAVAEALYYCRDRGYACWADGARLSGGIWRVRLDVARRRHRHRWGAMVVDLDAWSGEVLSVRGGPRGGFRWQGERSERRHWDDD